MKQDFTWEYSNNEKRLILSIIAKGKAAQQRNEKFAIISLGDFYSLFDDDELVVLNFPRAYARGIT